MLFNGKPSSGDSSLEPQLCLHQLEAQDSVFLPWASVLLSPLVLKPHQVLGFSFSFFKELVFI